MQIACEKAPPLWWDSNPLSQDLKANTFATGSKDWFANKLKAGEHAFNMTAHCFMHFLLQISLWLKTKILCLAFFLR